MVENKKELTLKLSDRGSLVLNNMIYELRKSESEVVNLALNNMIKDIYMVDEYELRSDRDYDIYEFEGLINFTSKSYGFLVIAEYSDFEDGIVYYDIYIPFNYLSKRVGISSWNDYNDLMIAEEEGYDLKTNNGYDLDQVNDELCDIRDVIESELIILLEEINLIKKKL